MQQKETSSRSSLWLFLAMGGIYVCLVPWSGHAFDTGAFLNMIDRTFYAGVPMVSWWPFGLVSLLILFATQWPFLLIPTWSVIVPARLLLLKIPFILADLAGALAVRNFALRRGRPGWIGLSIFASPAIMYTSVVHGTFDGLAGATVVFGTLALLDEHFWLSAVCLGLGAGTKYYPLFLLPLFCAAIFRTRGLRPALTSGCIAAAIALLTILPVHILNPQATSSVVQNTVGPSVLTATSAWSIYYPLIPQIPQILKFPLAACALFFPTLLGIVVLRTPKEEMTSALIARYIAVAMIGVVIVNPGAAPQFVSWIVAPVAIAVVLGAPRRLLAGSAVAGLLSTILEYDIEAPQALLSGGFQMASGAPSPYGEGVTRFLSLLFNMAVFFLIAGLLPSKNLASHAERRLKLPSIGVVLGAITLLMILLDVGTIAAFDRGAPLRDLANRERLNMFTIPPVAVTDQNAQTCTLIFDIQQLGIRHIQTALPFFDASIRVGGPVFPKIRIGARVYEPGQWIREQTWTIDTSLKAHASGGLLSFPSQLLGGNTKLSLATQPCSAQADPVIVVYLNIQRAEEAYFHIRRP